MLTEREAKTVSPERPASLPSRTEFARTAEEAHQPSPGDMDFPVALKISSADIAHKSDIGGVHLNLDHPEAAVRHAFDDIHGRRPH